MTTQRRSFTAPDGADNLLWSTATETCFAAPQMLPCETNDTDNVIDSIVVATPRKNNSPLPSVFLRKNALSFHAVSFITQPRISLHRGLVISDSKSASNGHIILQAFVSSQPVSLNGQINLKFVVFINHTIIDYYCRFHQRTHFYR